MTIKQALIRYSDIEIELLLGHVLKQPKEFLYLQSAQKLTDSQENQLEILVNKRREGIPVAYLLGYKDFFGLRLKVNRHTLIPRPESEWLVSKVLQIIKTLPAESKKKIIDIGTGSGALATAIATKIQDNSVTVFASDISEPALAIAKANAKAHQAKVTFKKQNLLTKDKHKYNIIIANLPYVPQADYDRFYENLKHEPKSALVDPKEDFDLYLKLLNQAKTHLQPRGVLLMEIDPNMKALIQNWQKHNLPKAKLKFTKDIHGLYRYAELALP